MGVRAPSLNRSHDTEAEAEVFLLRMKAIVIQLICFIVFMMIFLSHANYNLTITFGRFSPRLLDTMGLHKALRAEFPNISGFADWGGGRRDDSALMAGKRARSCSICMSSKHRCLPLTLNGHTRM